LEKWINLALFVGALATLVAAEFAGLDLSDRLKDALYFLTGLAIPSAGYMAKRATGK